VEERRYEKLPIVPLPSEEELSLRKLLANYGREVRIRTRQINTLHTLFVHQGHTMVVKKRLVAAERRWEADKVLRGREQEEAEWMLKYLEPHEGRLQELRGKIRGEAKRDEGMKALQTVAGVGPS
jgi:hypothetical protein